MNQNGIHSTMVAMLGVSVVNGQFSEDLPHPLEAGEPERRNQDGAELYNPDWYDKANATYNAKYLKAAAKQYVDNQRVSYIPGFLALTPLLKLFQALGTRASIPPKYLDVKYMHSFTLQYFETLCRRYKTENNADAHKKYEKNLENNKNRARKSRVSTV